MSGSCLTLFNGQRYMAARRVDATNLQIIMNMTKKKQQKNCRAAAEYRRFIGKDTKFLLFRKSQGAFL